MYDELSQRPEYWQVRRSSGGSLGPVPRIMAVRTEAVVDRARIGAETANEEFQAQARLDAGYNLAEYLTARARRLDGFIHETGNDPELHQLHSFIKGAATEAIINLMRGEGRR